MTYSRLSLALIVALAAGCSPPSSQQTTNTPAPHPAATPPSPANADAFVAKLSEEARVNYPEQMAAQWVASTYINGDTELLTAKANERALAKLNADIEQTKRFEGLKLSADTARAIALLKLSTAMPAPKDPKKLAEITRLASKLEGMYGSGKYCTGAGENKTCRELGDLEEVLRTSRDYDAQLDAWQGWHTVSMPMREDYQRFAELLNEGARELGSADAGQLWRAGYDMSPGDFEAETDRLWDQVKPLYQNLQCYVRDKLKSKYGEKGSIDGMIPAHLTGNMWAQQWGNIWDLVQPYANTSNLDVTGALEKMRTAERGKLPATGNAEQQVAAEREADRAIAREMTRRAESFYTSLGMPALPASFYEKSQLIKPRDRDVVCHASAWDLDYQGDVRIKMCIEPTEDSFTTIYHELGHIYYFLAYNRLPPIFQAGANDGFHEAIGDTIVLAMTPDYLHSIGLVGEPKQTEQDIINAQMRMALEKVAFLPFGKLIDQWRWGVFSGQIAPENYNKAWWDLRRKYQGVAAPGARGEEFFDPGAKYHVPGNTPYTRYFLSHILQFQFYRTLCNAAGYQGPLHQCTFYNNKAAGERYWTMLSKGASQPWQQTLKEMTGEDQMDASALIEYFAPLNTWLEKENQGKTCGWETRSP